MKEWKPILTVMVQYFFTAYIAIYAGYKILTITVVELIVPLKIMIAALTSLICFFLINITAYRLAIKFKGLKQGAYKLDSKEHLFWIYKGSIMNLMQTILNIIPGAEALFILLYKALGARIGLNSMITKYSLSDPEFISIGNNTVIGKDAIIAAHAIERGSLIIKKVRIGNNCLIGGKSIIFPGAEVGDGAIVAANSVVLKNQKIRRGELWGGSPAVKIKKK